MRRPYHSWPCNQVYLSGEVESCECSLAGGDKLSAKAAILVDQYDDSPIRLEARGFGRIAEEMSLVCKKGNYVYIEAKFKAKADVQELRQPYLHITYFECLLKREQRMKTPEIKVISVLDKLDPKNFLGDAQRIGGKKDD